EFFLGELDAAFASLTACIGLYDRERHAGHAYQFGQDPGTVALAYLSWLNWFKGDRKAAFAREAEALALGRSIHHPFSLSFALAFAGWLHLYARDHEQAGRDIEETIQLCTEQEIQVFLAHGLVTQGCLLSAVGDGDRGVEA